MCLRLIRRGSNIALNLFSSSLQKGHQVWIRCGYFICAFVSYFFSFSTLLMLLSILSKSFSTILMSCSLISRKTFIVLDYRPTIINHGYFRLFARWFPPTARSSPSIFSFLSRRSRFFVWFPPCSRTCTRSCVFPFSWPRPHSRTVCKFTSSFGISAPSTPSSRNSPDTSCKAVSFSSTQHHVPRFTSSSFWIHTTYIGRSACHSFIDGFLSIFSISFSRIFRDSIRRAWNRRLLRAVLLRWRDRLQSNVCNRILFLGILMLRVFISICVGR